MPAARSPVPSRSTCSDGRPPGRIDASLPATGENNRRIRRRATPAKGRISSWRVERPDIVPPSVRGSSLSARSAPPYHLCAGIRSARARAVLPHVPDRTAQVRPAVPAQRHHQPPADLAGRRDRVLVDRDQGRRLADPHQLRFPAVRGPDPARPGRADLEHGFSRHVDLLAAGVPRHHRAVLAGALAVRDLHHLPAFPAVSGGAGLVRHRLRLRQRACKPSAFPTCSASRPRRRCSSPSSARC